MKHWMMTPIAICMPIVIAGCASTAPATKTETMAAKAAPAATAAAKAAPAPMAKMAKMDDSCKANKALTFVSATDDGSHEDTHPPKMAIDGNLDSDSRWSSKSEGSPKSLNLKLSAPAKVGAVSVAWLKGDERWSKFSIETSKDGKSYTEVVASQQSSGKNKGLEQYAFKAVDAQYIRINGNGNMKNTWNSIVEAKAYGCGA